MIFSYIHSFLHILTLSLVHFILHIYAQARTRAYSLTDKPHTILNNSIPFQLAVHMFCTRHGILGWQIVGGGGVPSN